MNWKDDEKKIDALEAPAEEVSTDPTLDTPEEELATQVPPEQVADEPVQLEGGEIEVPDPTPEEPKNTRLARAVQLTGDEVTNVIMVVVDEDDQPVGFEVPYGTELVVVEDDNPTGPGWVRIDGEFVNPAE